MYCRQCQHDLRGQAEPRCPECGSQFDPQDTASYLLNVPTGLQTGFRIELIKTFAKLLVIASLCGTGIVLFLAK